MRADGLLIKKRSDIATPRSTLTSLKISSKAKPSLKISRKSSDSRRGNDCRLNTPSNLPMPGSMRANCPLTARSVSLPESVA